MIYEAQPNIELDWQATIVIVSGIIIASFIFRAPISRLIDRISSASKDGVTFGSPQDIREDSLSPLPFAELMNQPVSASVLEREQTIQSQLQEYKLKNEEQKISALSRALATTRIALEFKTLPIGYMEVKCLFSIICLVPTTELQLILLNQYSKKLNQSSQSYMKIEVLRNG